MKKKILSALLIFALLLSFAPSVLAGRTTLESRLKEKGVPQTVDLDVLSNIALKFSGDNTYSDVLITSSKSSSEVFPKIDYQATVYLENVRDQFTQFINLAKAYCAGDTYFLADLADMPIYGQFTIDIIYPDDVTIPSYILNGNSMAGFNDNAKLIFAEISRAKVSNNDGTSTLSIKVATKNPVDASLPYVTESQLEANLTTYLSDLTLTCLGIIPTDYGTRTIKGRVSGWAKIGADQANPITTFNYTMVQDTDPGKTLMAESFKVIQKSTTETLPPSPYDAPPVVDIIIDITTGDDNYKSTPYRAGNKYYIDVDNLDLPERTGFVFDGWYFDKNYAVPVDQNLSVDPNGKSALEVTDTTKLYAKWVNVKAPSALASEDHNAYVIGYPEGDVRPENNITREEIATIFYRLLREDNRAGITSSENDFSDVEKDRWSNKAISTMANGGFIQGYPDGTFGPSQSITRAEFVTIAARFLDNMAVYAAVVFSDIDGHWAEQYILAVTSNNWINGYEDGTFRPDRYITRAEAMAIINRMLVRYLALDGIHADTKQWSDNPSTEWYYLDVLEATNSHTYERMEDKYHETWKTIEDNKIWTEKAVSEDAD